MLWISLIGGIFGAWTILCIVAAERQQRLAELERRRLEAARLRAEALAARHQPNTRRT
ncbi:hypothetical protein [Fontivita pretiosa]|uniref:hypothetical protein n=1 Tax=Fontivita pretiosa TaxID=2989684 RepID=UPI003D1840A4